MQMVNTMMCHVSPEISKRSPEMSEMLDGVVQLGHGQLKTWTENKEVKDANLVSATAPPRLGR